MRRHALNRITHRPERLERPPINPKRQFLAVRLPPPRMRPVINLRRTQHFSAARYESAPDPHLHRTAALGWRRRPVTQVTMVRPFHWRCGVAGCRRQDRLHRAGPEAVPRCQRGLLAPQDRRDLTHRGRSYPRGWPLEVTWPRPRDCTSATAG